MRRRILTRCFVSLGAAFLVCAGMMGNVSAASITSNSLSSPTTLDFSQFTGGGEIIGFVGPIQIGAPIGEDITFSGDPGASVNAFNGNFGLGDNGTWNAGRNGYLGNSKFPGRTIITFNDGPVSGVGAFMNYAVAPLNNIPATNGLVLSIFNSLNILLETFDLPADAPISTPGALNEGAFRGFARDLAEIARFEIFGDFTVLDDLRFTRSESVAAIPLPAALPLFGTGLGILGFMGWRRRRKVAAAV